MTFKNQKMTKRTRNQSEPKILLAIKSASSSKLKEKKHQGETLLIK